MRVPLVWLRESRHRPQPEQLAERLTLLGMEVNSSSVGGVWSQVVIGELLTVRSTRARTGCRQTVNLGDGANPVDVCGATNIARASGSRWRCRVRCCPAAAHRGAP